MSYKYPTREQAERIASETCGIQVCGHCDIAHWCVHDPNDNSSATRVCGASMLAMHDALDAKQAENDRLRGEVERLTEDVDRRDNLIRDVREVLVDCYEQYGPRYVREMIEEIDKQKREEQHG